MKESIKHIKTRLAEASLVLISTKNKLNEANAAHSKAKYLVRNLQEKLREAKKGKILVTEHAMLRYLERVLEIDMEAVKNNILPENIKSQIEVLGNGKYPVRGKFKVVVKDRMIVTVEN